MANPPQLLFFPVGNGDMTLVKLESGRTILIDVSIRVAADNPNEPTPDVAALLKETLKRDSQGRLYVDVFLLTHPDQDHCRGIARHFHLGPPETYSRSDNKIFIREIWSSPIVFRRASKILMLCEDAQVWATEARRRVKRFQEQGLVVGDGDRIQILGEDENDKTDGLGSILIKVDQVITKVNGVTDSSMSARLLGPLPKSENEDEEKALAKNRSSVILQFELKINGVTACYFLTGGDAEVAIWERLWRKHQNTGWLTYDILQSPHHCSWRSLSNDSWSDLGEDAKVSEDARNALSQARPGARIIASCKPISPRDSDPPCIRADREYRAIAKSVSGEFKCTSEYPTKSNPDLMVFEITQHGPRLKSCLSSGPTIVLPGAVGRQPLGHG